MLKTGETQAQSRLWISNGLNPSTFEYFEFTNSATRRSTDKFESDNVWRDLLTVNGKVLMVERDTNRILSLDPSKSPLQSAVWASGAGLNKPEQLALLPDGSVLVTNAASRNVSRFSSTGQYLGDFISAGSAGLGNPGGIAVDNLGNVYVCSTNTNKILKFNSNGAPVAELATATTVGLDQPVSLLLTGEILDTAPFDANNDTDGDGVANKQDAFPLDPSRSAVEPTPPPAPAEKSGGSTGPIGLVGLLLLGFIRRQFCRYFL
ncbi:MAG: SBBP repeat-containing protein [Rheinheimera sp.]|nr:SBBP repeat-containing protein [Rheinheimera sp.]